tara:strand:+ start:1508 stop:2767 length:1260 start_codon:yes stop_codon:yes gene_type:complete
MKNKEDLGNKVFDFLKGKGVPITISDENDEDTLDPEVGVRFYSNDPNIMVTIDKENNELKLSKSKHVEDERMDSIHKGIQNIAQDSLFSFDYKIFGKSIKPKHSNYKAKINKMKQEQESVTEASLGKMYGSMKTSYQPLDSVKIIVRHGKPVNEEVRGARSRQISKLFIQRGDERFALPHKSLAGARAMARHVHNGGEIHDSVGSAINEMVNNIDSLSKFARYVENKNLVNEENNGLVILAKESVQNLRSSLKKLSGAKSYAKAVETIDFTNSLEITNEESDLSDLFVEKHIDNNVLNAFPTINKLLSVQHKMDEYISNTIDTLNIQVPIAETGIEYPNTNSEIAHKLSIISEFIDDKVVKNFIENCSTKILKGSKLDETSMSNIKKLISKTNMESTVKDTNEILEFINFTKKLDNIVE